jgi:hypothetical protein
MERNREETKKKSGEQSRGNGGHSEQETSAREKTFEDVKKARILQCLGNLNALHKVQGALLGQMEREIE